MKWEAEILLPTSEDKSRNLKSQAKALTSVFRLRTPRSRRDFKGTALPPRDSCLQSPVSHIPKGYPELRSGCSTINFREVDLLE